MAFDSIGDMTQHKEMKSPGVRIPPPVIYAVALLAGWLLQLAKPLPLIPEGLGLWVGIPIALVGLALAGWSIAVLVRGHGTLNTNGQSVALVERGPYQFSRNPMYVALAIIYSGAAVALNLPWGIALLPVLLIYTYMMVIAREEAYLTRAFGQEYENYKGRVRRWL